MTEIIRSFIMIPHVLKSHLNFFNSVFFLFFRCSNLYYTIFSQLITSSSLSVQLSNSTTEMFILVEIFVNRTSTWFIFISSISQTSFWWWWLVRHFITAQKGESLSSPVSFCWRRRVGMRVVPQFCVFWVCGVSWSTTLIVLLFITWLHSTKIIFSVQLQNVDIINVLPICCKL